jgi:hypothetical protein
LNPVVCTRRGLFGPRPSLRWSRYASTFGSCASHAARACCPSRGITRKTCPKHENLQATCRFWKLVNIIFLGGKLKEKNINGRTKTNAAWLETRFPSAVLTGDGSRLHVPAICCRHSHSVRINSVTLRLTLSANFFSAANTTDSSHMPGCLRVRGGVPGRAARCLPAVRGRTCVVALAGVPPCGSDRLLENCCTRGALK